MIGLVSRDRKSIELLRPAELGGLNPACVKFSLKPEGGLLADAILQKKPLWFEHREQFAATYPYFAVLVAEQSNIQAVAGLPLRTHDHILGAMMIAFTQPHQFTPEEQNFLTTLADQCAQALERAQLYDAEHQARHEAEQSAIRFARLQNITAQLAQPHNRAEIAEIILQEGLESIGASAGSISLLSENRQQLDVIRMEGYSTEMVERWPMIPMIQTNLPLVVAVSHKEAVWLGSPEERRNKSFVPERNDAASAFQAWAALPLIVNDECIGALGLSFSQPQQFDAKQTGFALALADQCAQALERAHLRNLARESAALEERQRLARELHDSVSQVLYAATNTAESLPRLLERDSKRGRAELEQLVILNRAAMAEMRTLLLELRPEAIIRTPMKQLLIQLVRAIQGRKNIKVEANLDLDSELRLPPDAHVACYRIAQETINNVVKHSGASAIEINVTYEAHQFELRITDNGEGFDLDHAAKGLGLHTMRERALEIGATFSIRSSPNAGTEVTLHWANPLSNAARP
jgi:signal transduction histidine kinase